MKNINLLPSYYLEGIKLNKLIKKITAVVAVIFFILILIVHIILATISNYQTRIDILTEELNNEKFSLSDKTYYELLEKNKLEEKIKDLNKSINTDYLITMEYINAIMDLMTNNMYAYEFEISMSDDPESLYVSTILFSGLTHNREDLVAFIKNIELYKNFDNVELIQITNLKNGLIRFELTFSGIK